MFCFHYVPIKRALPANCPDLIGVGIKLRKIPLAREPAALAQRGGLCLQLQLFLHLGSASAACYLYRSRVHCMLSPASAKEGKSLPWKADGCSQAPLLRGPKAGQRPGVLLAKGARRSGSLRDAGGQEDAWDPARGSGGSLLEDEEGELSCWAVRPWRYACSLHVPVPWDLFVKPWEPSKLGHRPASAIHHRGVRKISLRQAEVMLGGKNAL